MSGVYLFRIPRVGNYGSVLFYRRTYVHHAGLAQRRWGSKVLVFLDVPYERVLVVSRSGVAFCPSLVMSDARHSVWDETNPGTVGSVGRGNGQIGHFWTSDVAIYRERWGEKRDRLSPSGSLRSSTIQWWEHITSDERNSNEARAWLPFHDEYSRWVFSARPIPVLRG